LALAFLFPNCIFTAVDFKAKSIEILQQRAVAAGLNNVCGIVGKIEEYQGSFDVCLALHACGVATDFALQQAKRRRAAYVVCPCCVGNLKYAPDVSVETIRTDLLTTTLDRVPLCSSSSSSSSRSGGCRDAQGQYCSVEVTGAILSGREVNQTSTTIDAAASISHPRSKWLNQLLAGCPPGFSACEVYTALARAGDIAHGSAHSSTQGQSHTHEAIARACKSHLELDRNMHMEEAGYDTALMQLLLSELTGKGDLLVGVPREWTPPPPVAVSSVEEQTVKTVCPPLLPWSVSA
jgi:hypothetical protein